MPVSRAIQHESLDFDALMKTLTDSFNVLADEVQILSDRKTILEHKLSFAREQYQSLADKYAPASDDIGATLAALQLPPNLRVQVPGPATSVPLPIRLAKGSKQQTAEAIRDGRQVVQILADLRGWCSSDTAGEISTLGTAKSTMATSQHVDTAPTSHLEQDFTVAGKTSKLLCPFADAGTGLDKTDGAPKEDSPKQTHARKPSHHSLDPICAAMYGESNDGQGTSISGSAAKCPIRYLDQHSPEEIAQYFEQHKHEIPRSHEICVKRYQRNENDVKKLDAKYGNIVSMIQGLGQKHQPMLPLQDGEEEEEQEHEPIDHKSKDMVETWAQTVTADVEHQLEAEESSVRNEDEREARFDRPMQEVRLGESPSRPWGIRVPFVDTPTIGPVDLVDTDSPSAAALAPATPEPQRPKGKCPIGRGQKINTPATEAQPGSDSGPQRPTAQPRPTFLQAPDLAKAAGSPVPQMVFTGPVFIGYPVDQAMALMQQWQVGAKSGSGGL